MSQPVSASVRRTMAIPQACIVGVCQTANIAAQ